MQFLDIYLCLDKSKVIRKYCKKKLSILNHQINVDIPYAIVQPSTQKSPLTSKFRWRLCLEISISKLQ